MKRRTFLRALAVAGAFLCAGVSVPRSRAQAELPPLLRIAITGQSNAVGELTAATTWTTSGTVTTDSLPDDWEPGWEPTGFYPDGKRRPLSDPTHKVANRLYPINASSVYGGSPWPLVARGLMQAGYRVEFVFCAKAGSSVGAWRYPVGSTETTCLRGATIALCQAAGPIDLALWHQGESNAMGNTTEATYLQVFSEVRAWMNADLGAPVMPALLQHCYDPAYPGQAVINSAIQTAWTLPGVVRGPDFRDISVMPTDTVHLKTTAHAQTVAARWVAAILAWRATL